MPTAKLVEGWASEVPEGFTFALKAPQRITHIGEAEGRGRLGGHVREHGGRARRQARARCSFSSRRSCARTCRGSPSSWSRRRRGFASPSSSGTRRGSTTRSGPCCGRTAPRSASRRARSSSRRSSPRPTGATCDCGATQYSDAVIAEWADKILAQPWKQAFVFLKHDEGDAPSVARRLMDRLGRTG